MACGAAARMVRPFIFQAIAESPQMPRACSRIWARDKYPASARRAARSAARRKADKKIRIGYVSGEFRQQATAILMAGAL